MNEGKYVFTQVTGFIPRQIFLRLVDKYKGDYRVRDFNCTNQLQYLLFGQLTSCESLRDICLCLKQNEEILDSTTISCSLKLMEWAMGKYSKGAVKMHTLINLRGSIPVFIFISDGRYHDSNVLDQLEVIPNAIYTMDKAYVDFKALNRIDDNGGLFITRAKDNMKYDIVSTNHNINPTTGMTGDYIIRLTGYKTSKLYPKELRLIKFCDFETGEELEFITNITDQLELSGLEIANIYRHRWDIESFFKLIKQNLTIKHLWGCSENAVKTHLWIAVCTYLLLARIKAVYNSPYSITEIATLVRVSALAKKNLKELVTEPQPLIQNQNVKEPTLF